MKKAIVTGAAGFLGAHLSERLIEQGYRVLGIDNLSTGKAERLKPLERSGRFRLVVGDVSDAGLLKEADWAGCREIFHLASPASPKFYRLHPFLTIEANTAGTRNMLELARRSGARLLYTSTSEAYGDPEVSPQHEEYRGSVNTWGPRACYDESKRLGEVICYEYFQRYGVQVKVARIFNTYSAGLRNDDGRVISNFVTQALAGEDLTIYGDGRQTRSFCYVDDTIRGLLLMMQASGANGQIINIGNPVEYTILEVAELVKSLSGSSSRFVFLPLPQDDPKVRKPDIGKARRLLGWEPAIGLEEGLVRTIETYRSMLKR